MGIINGVTESETFSSQVQQVQPVDKTLGPASNQGWEESLLPVSCSHPSGVRNLSLHYFGGVEVGTGGTAHGNHGYQAKAQVHLLEMRLLSGSSLWR